MAVTVCAPYKAVTPAVPTQAIVPPPERTMWRLYQLLAVLVSVALLGSVQPAPAAPSRDCSVKSYWLAEFRRCGGDVQSPSGVMSNACANYNRHTRRKPRLIFAKRLRAGTLKAENTGRLLKVTLQNGCGKPVVQLKGSSPGPLNGLYTLDNLYLHWNDLSGGCGSESPTEGTVGQAEAHFVFFNQQYGNVSAALGHTDGLAVVGLLLRPNSPLVPALPTLGMDGDLANLTAAGSTVTRQQDLRPLRRLLRAALRSFFSYLGSITTTPCNSVVTWLVADRPFSIRAPFLQQLRTSLYDNSTGGQGPGELLDWLYERGYVF